ncbi:MAG: phosphatidylserine/phosphatidylglycerophosphate/cardiolipin synthase family protein [Oligoflexia bacterium]|nr:phosphatidylserine/phosphatidylglycerophosphate/cardiolipin synthase family protein [Oligoflexia bacterium]
MRGNLLIIFLFIFTFKSLITIALSATKRDNEINATYKFVNGKCQKYSQKNILLYENLNPLECIWDSREIFIWKKNSNSNSNSNDSKISCYKYQLTENNFRGKKVVINKRTKFNKTNYNDCITNKAIMNDVITYEDHLKDLYNNYTESILKRGEGNCTTKQMLQEFHNLYQNTIIPVVKKLDIPKWSVEELVGANQKPIKLYGFYNKFKDWMTGKKKVEVKDLALRFTSTDNNNFDVFRDHEGFWPELVKSVKAAKESINIQVFGLQADPWGWEFGKLLAKKAREGVKVKILADSFGARMTFWRGKKTAPLIKFLQENGVEVVLSSEMVNKASFHYDHRKFFIIDGKTAYNTGYTIENHMRHKHFDVGLKAKGDIVKQMQASFFISYNYFGKKKIRENEFANFIKTYFPEESLYDKLEAIESGRDKERARAKININIPRYQHPITENYYNKIWNAKKSVWVINPYFSDKRIIEALEHATKKGVKVHIITPSNPENVLYKHNTKYHYQNLLKLGAETLLYDGPDKSDPEKVGWLHAKGIVIDEGDPTHCFASFGSTNMDAFALYHNYEQNIETSDYRTVNKIKEKVFDYAKKYSHEYELPNTIWSKFSQWFMGGVTDFFKKVLNPRPYRYQFTEEEDLQNVANLTNDDTVGIDSDVRRSKL